MTTQVHTGPAPQHLPSIDEVGFKLEVVRIPVADVDRAKQFYTDLGWRLDADLELGPGLRGVQFTPPGSPCSIQFGTGITPAAPGSAQGLMLVVSDIDAARAELAGRGVAVSEVFHFERGKPVPGHDPGDAPYSAWAAFTDPDGNGWLLQEVKARLPGRGGFVTEVATMTELLRETEEHHGAYERVAPKHHWSKWYAAYMVARERGSSPEDAARDAALHVEGALP